jgi:hypothetical protein
MHPNVAGALVNSALYLTGVFVAGLVTAHPDAWKGALAAAGLAFFSHVAQLAPGMPRAAVLATIAASWVLGAAAGMLVLF